MHPEPTPEVTFLRHCVKEFVPSGPLETLPQDKPEEDFLVNKLRTPGLLCEENLHCIHVLSCEWERRSLLQNFPVLTSPARLSDKWQCDHLAESMIFLLPFSDLIKIEVSLLVHVFIGQPSLEGGKTHPLGEIPRSNLKKTPTLKIPCTTITRRYLIKARMLFLLFVYVPSKMHVHYLVFQK